MRIDIKMTSREQMFENLANSMEAGKAVWSVDEFVQMIEENEQQDQNIKPDTIKRVFDESGETK